MMLRTRIKDLPLRVQLTVGFMLLSLGATVATIMILSTISVKQMNAGLQQKSARYAHLLAKEFAPAERATGLGRVRELLSSLSLDTDIDGLAIFAGDGSLITGLGQHPQRLAQADTESRLANRHFVAVESVSFPHASRALTYVSLSSRKIDAIQVRSLWIAIIVGGAVMLCAFILAAAISRFVTRRLSEISAAAARMGTGEMHHPNLDDHIDDEIGTLAGSFNVMTVRLERLAAENARQVATERERLESLVSERTAALEQSREMFRLIAESTLASPFSVNLSTGEFIYLGDRGIVQCTLPEAEWRKRGALDALLPRAANGDLRDKIDACEPGIFEFEAPMVRADGVHVETRWNGTCEVSAAGRMMRGKVRDVTEFRRMGRERAAAQKLESVGRLAAGVAHEINTPVQFVTDNVQFVRTSLYDLAAFFETYRKLKQDAANGGEILEILQAIEQAEKKADLEYVMENAPLAVDSSLEGLSRIAAIVRSMKQFAHPDQAEKTFADLNQAIRSTLIIANNEFKYVALLETHFEELPPVQCHLGEINQVILNLIVNASHAMGDVVKGRDTLGKLTVSTRVDGDMVEIAIADTGGGIPEAVQAKIFDPFFTTKEVGKGTGQGLAIARSVVVKKHGGTLHFETEPGRGTTFFIRLPIESMPMAAAEQDAA